jgi:prephenate dehydrogenase
VVRVSPAGFKSITVVGVGLIGGSLAAAVHALKGAPHVRGVDVDPETVRQAVERGVVDEALTPDEAEAAGWFAGQDEALIVLATPASIAQEWLVRLGAAGYGGTVTDVASTKQGVLETAQSALGTGRFVGGHPMAGSERSGIAAASADLFKGAYYVLTPAEDTDMAVFRKMHRLVTAIGARAVTVDAAAHDEAVAVVSHVPHVAAAALVALAKDRAGESNELLRLAAGGFKDTTRIAAGSPGLWTGILLDNADSVAKGLDDLRDMIGRVSSAVRGRDPETLNAWLTGAAEVRAGLPAQWVPATEKLSELTIPVHDRSGVISEVAALVGRAGCNIESIEIDHRSEDRADLVLVLTDEGDFDMLMSELGRSGYEPILKALDTSEGAQGQ